MVGVTALAHYKKASLKEQIFRAASGGTCYASATASDDGAGMAASVARVTHKGALSDLVLPTISNSVATSDDGS